MTGPKAEFQKITAPARGSRISKRVWIKASTETVYKALTESRELERWFCDRAACDASEGKELAASWRSGKSNQKGRAVFTRVVPGSILELLWIDDGDGVQTERSAHTLSYEIRSKSGMTELIVLDNDDSQADEETCQVLDKGWNSVLLELKDHCERKERSAKTRKPDKSLSHRANRK